MIGRGFVQPVVVGRLGRWMLNSGGAVSVLRSVYSVDMVHADVYLPDDLAHRAEMSGVNISSLTRNALLRAIDARSLAIWLEEVGALPTIMIASAEVQEAAAAKDDFERRG